MLLPLAGCHYLQQYVPDKEAPAPVLTTVPAAVLRDIKKQVLIIALVAGKQRALQALRPATYSPAIRRHVQARRRSGMHPQGLPQLQHFTVRSHQDRVRLHGTIRCGAQSMSFLGEVDTADYPQLFFRRFRFF